MLKAIAFGIAAGLAIQALRQWPADGPVTAWSVFVIGTVAIAAAFLGGLWHGRGRGGAHASATAIATATSTANNSVQVAVVIPGAGAASAGPSATGVSVPGASLPSWMEHPALVSDQVQLDGMDLAELVEESPDATV